MSGNKIKWRNNQGTKKMLAIDPEVIRTLDADAVSESKYI